MKKLIITIAIVSLTALYSKAQNTQINHGYWVTEYNIHTPRVQTVKFYNMDNQLVYEETINRKLNISKPQVQKALNQVVEDLYVEQKLAQRKDLLAVAFKLKK
jgi:hypothetical protein